jgi:hypothetical protein
MAPVAVYRDTKRLILQHLLSHSAFRARSRDLAYALGYRCCLRAGWVMAPVDILAYPHLCASIFGFCCAWFALGLHLIHNFVSLSTVYRGGLDFPCGDFSRCYITDMDATTHRNRASGYRGWRLKMATIIINAITHKKVCLDGLTESDEVCYGEHIAAYFVGLRKDCEEEGFEFEVDQTGQGSASYRVTNETGYDDLQAAHEFMQSRVDFWETV